MSNRITRESWNMIAQEILYVVDNNYYDVDAIFNELEQLLTAEGIIEVIDD